MIDFEWHARQEVFMQVSTDTGVPERPVFTLQGYLAHKKQGPLRTLQEQYT